MKPLRPSAVPLVIALVVALVVAVATWIPPAAGAAADPPYLVGVGKADVTGEAAEVGMMGNARVDQKTAGVKQRQWARAFVVAQPGGGRAVFVNVDVGQLFQGVHLEVIRRLSSRMGGVYTADNTILSATHSHSGPGGHSHYTLYNLTILGYQPKTYEAIVSGIVRSIERAHANLAPGTVHIGTSTLTNASVNRSRAAFDLNPAADRARFPDAIDSRMTVLKLARGGQPVGAISWFPTHGTSMDPDNPLITGDNKGYAEWAWERSAPGMVTAFAQTAAGDMSPNLRGGGSQGPVDDRTESTRIIGQRQDAAARQAFANATEELTGPVGGRLRYVNMSTVDVRPEFTGDGATHRTCQAALGEAFTAGAEDAPGPDFADEGSLRSNPLLLAAGILVSAPSPQLRACQAPKDVFLATGTQAPYPWTPEVLPVQVVRIGPLVLAAAPAEFTIVAGARLTDAVRAAMGPAARHVLLAGYANAYANYVTTPEEYDAQHYEGGSTLFGRWTLPAFTQEFTAVAAALRAGQPTPSAVTPRDLSDDQVVVGLGVVFDTTPGGVSFGQVAEEPAASYPRGGTARAVFWSGHPKNNLRTEGTFLEIQRQEGTTWHTVADDDDWETVYRWTRHSVADSKAEITWEIPLDIPTGVYRIVHHGDWKNGWTGRITAFTGTSRPFTVT
ncbi:neutral ceramidase [Virgisporangium aliadipatigenens]|uniref:Neutral ceramidase n=1 Tax=Virgisporangium aliadipatigenens TaxID=741659 RepID=A0A8J3YQE7_9ACTN|nr:neutral ceramidase [Virgisporangium aliadipatigenens]